MRLFRRLWVEITSFFENEELEEEISLKNLGIIFFLGLFILFGSYFLLFYNPNNIQTFINRYEFNDSHISYMLISCKDCSINMESDSKGEEKFIVVNYELSHKSYVWRQFHKILERISSINVDFGWVQASRFLYGVNWSSYDSVTVQVKGSGIPSNFEFFIEENDGDIWYYFDKDSLASTDWVNMEMNFDDFVSPAWASHGDGVKSFDNVKSVGFTINNFDMPVNNSLFFKVFDDEIFSLE